MTRYEFLEKVKSEKIDFFGDIVVSTLWNGNKSIPYYASYADADGVHATLEEPCDYVEIVVGFDEIDDKTFNELLLAAI